MKELAQTLKTLRLRHSLSQQAVADWFGINRASVNAWENPKKKALPERERLQVLAKKYETTVDAILDGSALGDASHHGGANDQIKDQEQTYPSDLLHKKVRVVDVVHVNADGVLEIVPTAQGSLQFIKTDKLPRAGNYYCWIVTSSNNPAIRTGAAILVDPSANIRTDRLCVATIKGGEVRLLAPLVESASSIKFEAMDGSTVSLLRKDIEALQYVAAIDADPVEAD